jgi:hypothetical protein
MKIVVTTNAKNQGLALARGHDPRPQRAFASSRLVEVCQLSDVVDFHRTFGPADLALFRQQSSH